MTMTKCKYFIVTDSNGWPVRNNYGAVLLYPTHKQAEEEAKHYANQKVNQTYVVRKATKAK